MFRILGAPRRLCKGITRRDFLQASALGAMGLGKSPPAHGSSPRTARAKACILLYLYGSPSQLETFDVKPDAPIGIRGDLGTTSTSIPAFRITELLPEVAKVVSRTTVVRSMTHPYPVHGIAYATSGLPDPTGIRELAPRDPSHWPFIGSAIDYLEEQHAQGKPPAVPNNLALPFPLSTRRSNQPHRAGPYGGFLGPGFDPIWTEFRGEGTKTFKQENRGVVQEFRDPYAGIRPDGRFEIASGGDDSAASLTLDRLDGRLSLLEQLDRNRTRLESESRQGFDRYRGMARAMLTSDRLRTALDLQREPLRLRESYGMTLFGQAALLSRRLVEAGSRFVSVFWDEYGLADSAWDTHYQHYPRMKNELCPTFDLAYSGLLRDLESRGMLDEVAVVCISEHGRTPQLSNTRGGGRDHWSRAYSAIFAGGGFAAGRVIGKTDKIAGDVVDTPVSPKDVLATVYHLLGYAPETLLHDRLGRPMPIAGEGKVRKELLG